MTRILIGVDAGGTRTRVRITVDGAIAAEGEGRAGAVRPGTALAASLAISGTVKAALTRAGLVASTADVLVVGAAGVGREPEREALAQALRGERLASAVVVVTDVAIALADAFGNEPGILLSAGTGSIAIARDATGAMHRVGGWGWQIGDEGSGAWLGREAVRAVLHMRDGRTPATALLGMIREAARAGDDDALVRWGNSVSATEFATLAPAVLAAAKTGDAEATRLRAEALAALAALAAQAAAASGTSEVALSGGLLRDAAFRSDLTAALAPLVVRDAEVDPLRGALRLGEA